MKSRTMMQGKSTRALICACALGLGLSLAGMGSLPAYAASTDVNTFASSTTAASTASITDEDVIGEWEFASMSLPGLDADINASMFSSLGDVDFSATLTINEDGTFVIAATEGDTSTQTKGTWEITTAGDLELTAQGETETATLENGQIVLSEGTGDDAVSLRFARPGDTSATTPSASTNKYVEDPQGFEGTWQLVGMHMETESGSADFDEDMFSFMEALGMTGTIECKSDGTFTLELKAGEESESVDGTWEETGTNSAMFTAEGEGISARIVDGRMQLESGTEVLIFAMLDESTGSASTSSAAADSSSTNTSIFGSTSTTEASTEFVGYWVMSATYENGETTAAPLTGYLPSFSIEADGTFTYDSADGVATGTWEQTGTDAIVLTADNGATVNASLQDGQLWAESGDTYLIFDLQ